MELTIAFAVAVVSICGLAVYFARCLRTAHERSTKFVEGVFLKTLDRGLSAADYGMRSKEIEARTEEAVLAGQLTSRDIDKLAAIKNVSNGREPSFDGVQIPGIEETVSAVRNNGMPIG